LSGTNPTADTVPAWFWSPKAVDGTGRIALGGTDASVRASSLDIKTGGIVCGTGMVHGLGGGNHTSSTRHR
jgi:hypothetical protein